MNCKKCKQYNTHTVEVINIITKRISWLCFSCHAKYKNYKLSSTFYRAKIGNRKVRL